MADKCRRCGRPTEAHKTSGRKEHRWPRIMCSGKDKLFTGKLVNGRPIQ